MSKLDLLPKCRYCGARLSPHRTYGWTNSAYEAVMYEDNKARAKGVAAEGAAGRGYAVCQRTEDGNHQPVQSLAETLIDLGVEW